MKGKQFRLCGYPLLGYLLHGCQRHAGAAGTHRGGSLCRCRCSRCRHWATRCSRHGVAAALLQHGRSIEAVAARGRTLVGIIRLDVLHHFANVLRLGAWFGYLMQESRRRRCLEETESATSQSLAKAGLHSAAERGHRAALLVHVLLGDRLLH